MQNSLQVPDGSIQKPEAKTRRSFAGVAIAGLTGTIAVLLGLPSAIYLFRIKAKSTDSNWIDAGVAPAGDQFPQEVSFRHNRIDGWKIHSAIETAWLARNSKGELVAFSPWCTHLGCAYRWEATRGEFLCPCHGSRFSKDGSILAGPAARPLDKYEVKIVGKRLWLAPPSSVPHA